MVGTFASAPEVFVTVPGHRHSEVGRNLAEPVPKALGSAMLDFLRRRAFRSPGSR
jgi:hypothetical protein